MAYLSLLSVFEMGKQDFWLSFSLTRQLKYRQTDFEFVGKVNVKVKAVCRS